MGILNTIKTIVALWIIAALSMSYAVYDLSRGVSEESAHIETVNNLINDIFTLNILTGDYIIHREGRAQLQWESLRDQIARNLIDIEFEGGEANLASLRRNVGTIENIFSQLVVNYEDVEDRKIAADFEARLVGQLSSISQAMVSDSFALSNVSKENISAIQEKISFLNLIFMLVVFVIAGVGGFVMLRGVAKPVQALAASEKRTEELNDVLRIVNKILRHDVLRRLVGARDSLTMFVENKESKWIDMSKTAVAEGIEVVNQMKELEAFMSTGKELAPINITELLAPLIKTYEIPVIVSGTGVVLADQALRSVFDNLIRNAILHGKATQVNIDIKSIDGHVELKIGDNGSGIDDQFKEKIFQEGFTAGDSGNTGLGLYIVKKTIERYGGGVAIKDNTPSGALFIINLKSK